MNENKDIIDAFTFVLTALGLSLGVILVIFGISVIFINMIAWLTGVPLP